MKYFTEIENNIFLPVNVNYRINHKLDNSKLPKAFYEKYQYLIDLIPKIKDMFLKFSLDKCYNNQVNSQHDKDYLVFLLQKYKTQFPTISSILNENLTLLEMKNSIQFYGNILDFMFMADNTFFDRTHFINIMQLFNSALIDIGNIDGSLAKRYLANKWLLTSRGYLYNMQTTNHEAGIYNNYYSEKIDWFLNSKKANVNKKNTTTEKIKVYTEDPSTILECGYMTCGYLDLLLHFKSHYQFNSKVYDSKTINAAIGMIELQKDLLDFFNKLELYTDSPKDSLRKVIEITNNKYLDVLIRCCGVSKISFLPEKTIITSFFTAKDDFREYLEKGYNVCFVPPIIINKEKRIVEELNMDSPIVSAYIKNEVICDNNDGRGKVYTNHIKF